jgi:hypothetical protein
MAAITIVWIGAMRSLGWQGWTTVRSAAAVAAVCAAALYGPAALAQDAAPPPQQKPGLFEAVGRWFDQSAANFRDHLKGAKRRMDELSDEASANSKELNEKAAEAGKNAAQATKGAVDAVAKLPTARMMAGKEKCSVAPNGAPDCLAAAEALCRKHGYASGKSMDFTSAEECPAKVYLGGTQSRAECQTVTFISRAMCQ